MCNKCEIRTYYKAVNGIDRDGKLFKGKGIILTNANADNSKAIKANPVLDKEGRIKNAGN